MAVNAKFTVQEVKRFNSQPARLEVVLRPDYGTSENPKNAEWATATPSGEIRMVIDNPAAAEQFEIGREFTVTFE